MKENPGKGLSDDARMPFTSHLGELRSRLIKSCLALAAAFFVCFAFAEEILFVLTAPLLRLSIPGLTLIGTGVPEAFFTKMKVAFMASVIVAFPILLWQAWQFIAPGLYVHEKHHARSFVFVGTLFFVAGVWFCYKVIFEVGYGYLISRYRAIGVRPAIRIGEYLSFSSQLMLAFGVAFELPVIAYFLTRIGMIDHRFLIRQSRYAFLLLLVLAAILTPPDVASQVLLTVPLTILYGVAIGTAYLAGKK